MSIDIYMRLRVRFVVTRGYLKFQSSRIPIRDGLPYGKMFVGKFELNSIGVQSGRGSSIIGPLKDIPKTE